MVFRGAFGKTLAGLKGISSGVLNTHPSKAPELHLNVRSAFLVEYLAERFNLSMAETRLIVCSPVEFHDREIRFESGT